MSNEPNEISQQNETIREAKISLILDSYDDIFSDFDPRSYSERALSDDFVAECKKAVREKKNIPQIMELRFLVPSRKRVKSDENKIKKRLKDFYQIQAKEKQKEMNQLRKEGLKWLAVGFFFSLVSTFLINQKGLIPQIILIITEPGGWFSFWTSLDKLFLEPKSRKHELEFYKSMSKMSIKFYSY